MEAPVLELSPDVLDSEVKRVHTGLREALEESPEFQKVAARMVTSKHPGDDFEFTKGGRVHEFLNNTSLDTYRLYITDEGVEPVYLLAHELDGSINEESVEEVKRRPVTDFYEVDGFHKKIITMVRGDLQPDNARAVGYFDQLIASLRQKSKS